MAFDLKTVFGDIETAASKVASFVVKEMAMAENFLGAKTGSAKANLVVSSVEAGLTALGVPVGTVQAELKTVADALTALFNKIGIFPNAS